MMTPTHDVCRKHFYLTNPISFGFLFAFLVVGLLCVFTTVHAQTLDDELTRLLAGGCAGLNDSGGTTGNLNAICSATTGSSNSSSGNAGGSSLQDFVTSVAKVSETFTEDNLELFFVGSVEVLNKDITKFEDGFNSDVYGLQVGGEYRFNNMVAMGISGNWDYTDGFFEQGGDFSNNVFGPSVNVLFNPSENFFVVLEGGYRHKDHKAKRPQNFDIDSGNNERINGFSSSNTNADIWLAQFRAGSNISWTTDEIEGTFWGPFTSINLNVNGGGNFTNTQIDGFKEKGNTGLELIYEDQSVNSWQGVGTLELSGVIPLHLQSGSLNSNIGSITPYIKTEYIHEFANSQRNIHVQLVNDSPTNPTPFAIENQKPERNWVNLGTGIRMLLFKVQAHLDFLAMVGNSQYESYGGTIGLRFPL